MMNNMVESQQQQQQPQQQQQKKVLIFIHGLFGSNLTNRQTGENAWLSALTIIKSLLKGNNGHTQLASKITWSKSSDGTSRMTQDMDDLEPVSPVTLFTKPWDDWCASLDPSIVDVRYFLWDWRRPMEETTAKLRQWILQQSLSKDNQAVLATYSTGSLIGYPIVNQYPELFKGWLNVGGAIGGGNFILNDFCNGWNKGKLCLLDAETEFTLASLYSFLPARGEPTGSAGGDHVWVCKETEKPINDLGGDIFDIQTWRENSLGIYQLRKNQERKVTEEEETHLKNALESANRFRQAHFVREGKNSFDDPAFLIHPQKAYDHLDVVLFGSEAHDNTHCGWYVHNNGKNVDIGSGADKVTGNGDGTIMTWAWKSVPGLSSRARIVTCADKEKVHVELMSDPKVQEIAAQMLGIDYLPPATARTTAEKNTDNNNKGFFFKVLAASAIVAAAWYLV